MVNRASKKKSEFKKSKLWSTLLAICFVLFILLVYLGICYYTPDKYKVLSIQYLGLFADKINEYRLSIKDDNNKFVFLLTYFISILLGCNTLLRILYFRFRKTPYFEIPFTKNLNYIPKIPNAFYAEELVKTPAKVMELKSKLSQTNKELTSCKVELDKIKFRNTELEEDNKKLAENLKTIDLSFEKLKEVVRQHGRATEEMYKLMDHVLHLRSIKEPEEFFNEFSTIMSEFANTIIKVTIDPGSDKYSSIMMIPPNESFLKIVGSNGLNYASRQKTFTKGQGFAGWIWDTGLPAVCGDVTNDSRFQQEGCKPSGLYKSIIGIPIFDYKNSVIGALFVQCKRPNAFDQERDSATLSYFAKLLAIIFMEYYSFGEKVIANGSAIGYKQSG